VNDAPALKKADAGIAVSGATDAARAAASIVLLAPGLSTIVDAIRESRRIFRRMTNYATYRVAETVALLGFISLAVVFYDFHPVTATMIVLLAILNDGAILSIAYDNVKGDTLPQRGNMRQILGVATALRRVGHRALAHHHAPGTDHLRSRYARTPETHLSEPLHRRTPDTVCCTDEGAFLDRETVENSGGSRPWNTIHRNSHRSERLPDEPDPLEACRFRMGLLVGPVHYSGLREDGCLPLRRTHTFRPDFQAPVVRAILPSKRHGFSSNLVSGRTSMHVRA